MTKNEFEELMSLPDTIQAAIYAVKDASQYLFHWRDEQGQSVSKFVSSNDVRSAFLDEPIDSGWIDSRIRRLGRSKKGDWFVAVIPSEMQKITVETTGEDKTLTVPFPTMVFFGIGSIYYAWAMQQPELEKDAVLFHAPLPNIGGDGKICWGSNKTGKVNTSDISGMWNLFLSSAFNAHSTENKSNKYPDDIRGLLVEINDQKMETYPIDDMCVYRSYKNTVDEVISDIVSGGR